MQNFTLQTSLEQRKGYDSIMKVQKKLHLRICTILLVTLFALVLPITVFATESGDFGETDQDELLVGATLVSEDTVIVNGREITTKIYILADGTQVVDELDKSALHLLSASGTNSVTRTRTVGNPAYVRLSISATFIWYTDTSGLLPVKKVKCSSASFSKTALGSGYSSNPVWDTSYTSNYVTIGSAKASVDFEFIQSHAAVPISGNFKITCTDDGNISDNG
jgi:hypothetical protein